MPVEGVLQGLERDLREQAYAAQVTHFLLTGQRGAGKTTHLALLDKHFREAHGPHSPYLPIFIREEHPGIYGLRGLYESPLEHLRDQQGISAAA
ncbi:MAG TPA: hypothetical protein EYP85_01795 [Armatimonadetes bacterium]|nr:hypothetical protein [Armatimonadota bacterium]